MKPRTKERVSEILHEFATTHLPKFSKQTLANIKRGYPFHRLLFSEEAIRSARVERSVVTSMGTSLYPSLAEAVSEDRFSDVRTEHVIEGTVNDAACNMIDQIVNELRTAKSRRTTPREPDHESELTAILNSPGGGQTTRAVTADLYIGDFTGGPLFIELKTPLPNLDIAAESKRKILYYLLIMDRKGVAGAKGFLGLTYNPDLTRAAYSHSFTKRIMDMERQVLIGEELWDTIGGPGTYRELLNIIDTVRGKLPDLK